MRWGPIVSLTLLILGNPQIAISMEVDSFTDREKERPEASTKLNFLINTQIRLAVDQANKDSPKSCDQKTLLKRIEFQVDSNWPVVREKFLIASGYTGAFIYAPIPKEKTVYGVPAMRMNSCCDPLVKVGGHLVGVDKVDHLLSGGFTYYSKVSGNGRLEDVLKSGVEDEEGGWGLLVTGVKSYADLAANYSGYLFYRDLLDSGSTKPAIQCLSNRYVLTREMDIRQYADDAWDEGINCSSYADQELANQVEAQIKKVSGGKTCPLSRDSCKALVSEKKYPHSIAKFVLHPNCIDPEKHVRVESGGSIVNVLKAVGKGVKDGLGRPSPPPLDCEVK